MRGGGDDDLSGYEGNDLIKAGNNNDNLEGEAGNDTLEGGGGSDTLYGGEGDDRLVGGFGTDYLTGGDGFDGVSGDHTLTDGAGEDVFIFGAESGVDIVTDFNAALANEVIDVSDWTTVTDYADLATNHFSEVDGNLVISSGDGHTITLQNVLIADVTAADFVTV